MNKVKLIKPTPAEDAAIAAGIAADPDTMEVSDAQFAEARAKRPRGRPFGSLAESRKESVTFRLDPDLVNAMKATGAGWQTRVNELLRSEFIIDAAAPDRLRAIEQSVAIAAGAVEAFDADLRRALDHVAGGAVREQYYAITGAPAAFKNRLMSIQERERALHDMVQRMSGLPSMLDPISDVRFEASSFEEFGDRPKQRG